MLASLTRLARRGEFLVASALAVLGLAFAWQATLLPLGTIELPGAGFFPLVLAVLLAVLGAATCVNVFLSGPAEETIDFAHRDVAVTVGTTFAIPLLFETVGAYLTLGLFSTALLILLGRVSPARAAVASALGMVAAWWFFKGLLGLQLPTGALF